MLSNICTKLKDKVGVALAAALAVLYLLFRYEQNRANKEAVAVENADVAKKDAVLAEKESEDVKQIAQIKQDAATQDAAKPTTPEQEIEALNKALQ